MEEVCPRQLAELKADRIDDVSFDERASDPRVFRWPHKRCRKLVSTLQAKRNVLRRRSVLQFDGLMHFVQAMIAVGSDIDTV